MVSEKERCLTCGKYMDYGICVWCGEDIPLVSQELLQNDTLAPVYTFPVEREEYERRSAKGAIIRERLIARMVERLPRILLQKEVE
jgi:hypothetical protein